MFETLLFFTLLRYCTSLLFLVNLNKRTRELNKKSEFN